MTGKGRYTFRMNHFRAETATSRQEKEMAEKCLRELHAVENSADPIHRLRLFCLSKGASGILELGRLFRRMDEDGNKKLNLEQFTLGMREINLEITDDEIKDMFKEFDTDGTGIINMEEFLVHIRPPLPDSRKEIIDEVFKKIDKNGDGEIPIETLRKVYNVKANPRYINGEQTEDGILNLFLENFVDDATRDGKVTKEEFCNYYCAVSTAIDNDCYFNLMMKQAFRL